MAAKFPCANPPPLCDQQPNPSTQFSSEASDSTTFIGIRWNGVLPPLGAYFEVFPCEQICESNVSQQAADLCAQDLTTYCISPCLEVFQNTPQTAVTQCPDGSSLFFIQPANTFSALNQLLANREAFTFAEKFLLAHKVCINGALPSSCLGAAYSAFLTATGKDSPFTFEVVDGEVPPGLITTHSGNNQIQFTGVPTQFGTFDFTIQAMSVVGTFAQKQVSVTISGITTGSPLPSATVGTNYAVQLQSIFSSDSVMWSLVSGSLPDGLSIDPDSGMVSGTPTTVQDSVFTAQATDGDISCTAQFEIEVQTNSDICKDGIGALSGNRYGISGYFDGMIPNGGGGGGTWDGTFPFYMNGAHPNAGSKGWDIGGPANPITIDGSFVCNVGLLFSKCVAGVPQWQIWIGDLTSHPNQQVWYGEKAGGQTPLGVYNLVNGSDVSPLTLTIVLVDMTATPETNGVSCVS